MITSLQGSQAAIATTVMTSIIDSIEDRRRDEEAERTGRTDDTLQQAMVQASETEREANARINEHFFGERANSEETMARIIARFSSALGLSQRPEETSRAFAQRLADAVAFIDAVSNAGLGIDDSVTLDTFGTTIENVTAELSGENSDDDSAALLARLLSANGLSRGEEEADADFQLRVEQALTRLWTDLPESVAALEKTTGLRDLGITASDFIEAIRNPYGSEATKVKDALAEKAREEKALTPELRKAIARIEDIADQKTVAELELEATRTDPTRVEDAETRAERAEDLATLDARERLEDVRNLQEAVSERQEKVADETAQDAANAAIATLQNLAAAAAEREAREEAEKDIFVLRVDENGIYDLITRQLAA
ncbi:hypothetical protein LXM94_03225 [Rhizobium sp. TRM95111]|uniref:hypothetical protein n=1 Tax=Rhizobium alarense TaxID=2846851 RepID=UPI001F3BC7FB|nr:hypothetical protein [Rhizobium alarense]MCF3638976.1 hypothetical protein [Rhizobium alarense]